MMVRIKWLLIGFFAGAAACGAAARYGCCTPAWMKMDGGACCGADDEAAGGAPGAEAPGEGPAA